MKKFFAAALLALCSLESVSQTALPDTFTIGNSVEVFHRDSVKIYINCTGAIVTKQCADYYRVGKIDPVYVNVKGKFYDYFLNGKLYLAATITDNKLEGEAKYYYSNGQLKEEGRYSGNEKIGTWKFYYPNGTIQKVYRYENEEAIVMEAFTVNGEQTVKGGNGYLKTEFSKQHTCAKFEASGPVVNGRKDGDWFFSNINAQQPISVETYKDGVYVHSRSNNQVRNENPVIGLTVHYGNESILLTADHIGCPGETVNGISLSNALSKLQKTFDAYTAPVKDQWLIVGIKLGKNAKLDGANVASSINDTGMEEYVYHSLLKTKGWEAMIRDGKRIESERFFSILVDNNKLLIPELLQFEPFRSQTGSK